jgi:hypothetical protein
VLAAPSSTAYRLIADCGLEENVMTDDSVKPTTHDQPPPLPRRVIRVLSILAILAGLGVFLFVVADQVRVRQLLAACRHSDPAVRIKALSQFANERDSRVGPVLAGLLEQETDPGVLEMAGYTAMRIGDTALLDSLQRQASQAPDDAARAKLIIYTARLSRRDVRLIPWLEAGLAANQEPWRQVASAAGLLFIGEPRGGAALIELARRPDHPAHAMALAELSTLVAGMTETVGWPITWPPTGAEPEPAFWANLDAFWKQHGDARLLADVITRKTTRDPRLVELGRLVHARDKIAKWF